MHCPPGGPRKPYCLLCFTHAPARHLTSPIHKMCLQLHARAKTAGLAVPSSAGLAPPAPAATRGDDAPAPMDGGAPG
eukprot:2024950-Lingulodinium_polyedra.AAC.1